MKKKVLILKLGYSETLNNDISRTCSLGDVLRTTVILNYFKDDNVTWVVDEAAFPLLENNPLIDKVLFWNLETVLRLRHEHYHTVVNLEKIPGVCALSDDIHSVRTYGFSFDAMRGEAIAQEEAERILAIATDNKKKRRSKKYWQQHLATLIRERWTPEHKYIIAHNDKEEVNDIGLNIQVGTKWPNKAWPRKYWHTLGTDLSNAGYKISWQEGYENLEEYMDWIQSNKLIVTCDTLGLHLSIAYGKKCVALFGPTSSSEIYLYGLGSILTPESNFGCIPCFQPICPRVDTCMSYIQPEEVFNEVSKVIL